MKKRRMVYGVCFCGLLLVEILIALYIQDRFIRPYVGDMLVTVLLCCLGRVVRPEGARRLPLYVFLFSAIVETAQYFDVVKMLGLEGNPFFSTIIGRTFSWMDLACYGAGCLMFCALEIALTSYIFGKK